MTNLDIINKLNLKGIFIAFSKKKDSYVVIKRNGQVIHTLNND